MAKRFIPIAILVLATGAAPTAAGVGSDLILKNYPRESLRNNEQGTVGFAVDLDEQGRLESCVVTESSGYPRLDAATCDMIVANVQFAPVEAGGERTATRRLGKVSWRVPAGMGGDAPPPPRVTVAQADLEAGRLVCKRNLKGGSFRLGVAYCLTQREWEQAVDYARREVETMIIPAGTNR